MAGFAVGAGHPARPGVGPADPDPPWSLGALFECAGQVGGGITGRAGEDADQEAFFGGDHDVAPAEGGEHVRFDPSVDGAGVNEAPVAAGDGNDMAASEVEPEAGRPLLHQIRLRGPRQ